MSPVHRSLVMFESSLRAKASSHRPMAQKAVTALGRQCVSLSPLRQLCCVCMWNLQAAYVVLGNVHQL